MKQLTIKRTIFFLTILITTIVVGCNSGTKSVKLKSSYPLKDRVISVKLDDLNLGGPTNFEVTIGSKSLPSSTKNNELFIHLENIQQKEVTIRIDRIEKSEFPESRTQAFIQVQEGTFNPEKPKAIASPYKSLASYQVPIDLVPHNQWIKFEGPVWESELIGYRLYADQRNLFDIFGKISPELALDSVEGNYHKISDWGADVLKVGESLGMASPALRAGNEYTPFSHQINKSIQTENNWLSSRVNVDINTWKVFNDTLDVSFSTQINRGQRWTEVEISLDKTSQQYGLAAGIVKHKQTEYNSGNHKGWNYCWSFGKQSDQGHELGMAVFIEEKYNPTFIETDSLNYLMHFDLLKGEAKYRFMAIWELEEGYKRDFTSFEEKVKQEIDLWNDEISIEIE